MDSETKHKRPLPGPEDRPGAALLIFDGNCRICTLAMRRLHRWDWRGRLAFLSLHDRQVGAICPDLTHDELMREIYLIAPQGNRYRGAEAIRVAAAEIPLFWPVVPLLYLPGSLTVSSILYRSLARWRYRFGRQNECAEGACAIHFRPGEDRPTKS